VRHVRILGLCVVAILAVGATVAGTASAATPEWGQCFAKAGGKYAESSCQTKAAKGKGTFEWRKNSQVKNKKFAGHNVGSGGVLTTLAEQCDSPTGEQHPRIPRSKCKEKGGSIENEDGSHISVECESEENVGETSGTGGVTNVKVTFKGCKALGTSPCSNTATTGEIVTSALKGTLGYISKSEKKVGLLLEPVKKHGAFAEFKCEIGITTVVGVGNVKEGAAYSPEKNGGYDGIISPITPVDKMTSEFEQVYTIVSPEDPENVPSHFEGKHIDLLEDYLFNTSEPKLTTLLEKAGEQITNVNHQESGEEAEIKA
jgi:hypothetical protein